MQNNKKNTICTITTYRYFMPKHHETPATAFQPNIKGIYSFLGIVLLCHSQ